MNFSLTEEELEAAGFAAGEPRLPFVMRAYEKTLTNGNTLTIARPAQEKPMHFVAEFYGRKPVKNYWANSPAEFAEIAAGRGKPAAL